MSFRDTVAYESRFDPKGNLLPWERSKKRHDFDPDFVNWIWRRYLPIALSKEASDVERWQAIQWLGKARFSDERLDDAYLQWDCYQAEDFKREDAEAERVQRIEQQAAEEFDARSPEAQAARERTRQMLKEKGLL